MARQWPACPASRFQPRRSSPEYSEMKPSSSVAVSARRRARARQLLDPQVAEVALRALRLQADVTLAGYASAGARDLLAVDLELEHAVLARDAIMVPLGGRLRPVLAGQAAHPAGGVRPVGLHRGAPDAEDVAVAGVIRAVLAVEDLDLERPRERHADGRQRVAPDEQPGVAARLHVPPFQLEYEVLVGPVGPHHAGRLARRNDQPVTGGEGLGRDVHRHPAGQILAVEQRPEVVGGPERARAGRHDDDGEAEREEGRAFHRGRPQRNRKRPGRA